ncbi:hypothetical protein B0H67DRAFT_588512 [Lasiosphaeris hirsuta]|uniref:Nephrocystin 3-like N-terminal domain-containing protein n=1 Tax=Lasiosphaeris hirsuta TaxID=260670 RepID=A0AA40A1W8_9PEZI|nr:hypothetical protein B0H67DRAFT_588512 [Lasiosphaeris hirsuta]
MQHHALPPLLGTLLYRVKSFDIKTPTIRSPSRHLGMAAMETFAPIVHRRSTLSNSAAEFVETRAGRNAVMELVDSEEDEALDNASEPEFVPELDIFAPRGFVFDTSKCYAESQKSLVRFKQTLERLAIVLRERNVETELGVVIKDPSEFTVDYVLGIANKIQEGRENSLDAKSCKAFIRRCYRKFEKKRSVVGAILTMVPDDAYGSVISGGFTLILAAVEKHAEQRKAIQKCLAEIPDMLEKIQRLSDVHRTSRQLHERADAVLVAIFFVLERIVDTLTRDKTTERVDKIKGMFKTRSKTKALAGYKPANDSVASASQTENEDKTPVKNALEGLKARIDAFQEQVEICAQEKLGQIKSDTNDLKLGMMAMEQDIAVMKTSFNSVEAWMTRVLNKVEEASEKKIYDTLYRLCASDPRFNARTGGNLEYKEPKLITQEQTPMSRRSLEKKNKGVVSRWLGQLKNFDHSPTPDVLDCLNHVEQLDADEKNIADAILKSKELGSWLRKETSSILDVDVQTPPANLNNPLSFATAVFATALKSTETFPVLTFFCKHRNNESPAEDKSGPVAMINSLNGQMLEFMASSRPMVDLSQLEDKRLVSKSQTTIKHGLALLDALLLSLAKGDMVFIVLDCLSNLSGSEKAGNKIVKGLAEIIEEHQHIAIKLLVTDASVDSPVKAKAGISLHIQDLVSGSGTVDVAETSELISRKLRISRGKGVRGKDVKVTDYKESNRTSGDEDSSGEGESSHHSDDEDSDND